MSFVFVLQMDLMLILREEHHKLGLCIETESLPWVFAVCLGWLTVENVSEMAMLEKHLIQSAELETSHGANLTALDVQEYILQCHTLPASELLA